MQNFGLIPLINFAVVDSEAGIFRSAQPAYEYQYKWLKDVAGIDVIVNLRSELHHDDYMNKRINDTFEVINIDVKDHNEPSLADAKHFMSIINECIANKKKVLFHCLHGHGRTSTFCVLARLAQGWNLSDAMDEESNIFHYSFRHETQKQFLIDNFTN